MGDLREVELDDEDEPAPRPGSRRRRWWLVVAALVVVGTLVGVQATMDGRRRAHDARYDDVAGVLLPVPDTLRVAWQRPDVQAFVPASAEVAGRVVHAQIDGDHRHATISVLDRASGEAVWTAHESLDASVVDAIAAGEARAERDAAAGAESDAESDDADISDPATAQSGATAVCAPLGRDHGACEIGWLTPWGDSTEPVATQVVVVDVAGQAVVSSSAAVMRMAAAVGDTVVVATSTTRDDEVVWSLDARDAHGRQRWTLTLDPVPVLRTKSGQSPPQTNATALDGHLLLVDQGHAWLIGDGSVLRDTDVGSGHYVMTAHGGALQAIPQMGGGDELQYGRILLGDGQWLTAHGYAVTVTVDDGSAPDLLLVDDDVRERLVARDARTGWELWSVPAGDVGTATVLGGVVLVSVGNTSDATAPSMTLEAIDARTGDVRWARSLMDEPTDVPQPVEALTDGRAVYARWGAHLKAFALEDGAPLAARDLPPGASGDDTYVTATLGMLTSIDYSTDASSAGLDVLG